MSLNGIGASPLPLQDGAKLVQPQGKELELGQIIFGKVLRVQQDGGYLVDIHGRQHVVDSAIPLRQDEVFRGKVVGLGERVVLEKMLATESSAVPAVPEEPALDQIDRSVAQSLQNFVQQQKKAFTVPQWNQLLKAAERTEQPLGFMTAAVFFQKLAANLDLATVRKLAERVGSQNNLHPVSSDHALHLAMAGTANSVAVAKDAVQALAGQLKDATETALEDARQLMHQQRPGHAGVGGVVAEGGEDRRDWRDDEALNQAVLHWLLNSQRDGAVSHRVVVLPLVFNGQLVELEMSLLDQKMGTASASELQSKLLHFSLETSALGKLGASIHVVNDSLRVRFSAASDVGLQALAGYRAALTRQLQDIGYRVDEVGYDLLPRGQAAGAARPILDFVVQEDSLSVLV